MRAMCQLLAPLFREPNEGHLRKNEMEEGDLGDICGGGLLGLELVDTPTHISLLIVEDKIIHDFMRCFHGQVALAVATKRKRLVSGFDGYF
ncbi:hypothetical protein TNIN_287931 [Trichonephila inaurata madagascariensis]|uniref:Uncharacterized protein n=1 Tax=Trichonephila inaurata madagascariensis TaxID=2747483 RepID=A0A8X7CIC7_9ARAC|nr:hypothetical protein TNIN_287931 [Trichonephila inaurata madagascariensis]